MAFIGFTVPPDVAKLLLDIDVPGDKAKPHEMHVTLAYLGKNTPTAETLKAAAACQIITQNTKPLRCAAAAVGSFPENPEDGFPIISRIVSPDIYNFRSRIVKALKHVGVEFSNRYPEYKPHVTLAYAKESLPYFKINSIIWTVTSIFISGGDDRIGEKMVTILPFG